SASRQELLGARSIGKRAKTAAPVNLIASAPGAGPPLATASKEAWGLADTLLAGGASGGGLGARSAADQERPASPPTSAGRSAPARTRRDAFLPRYTSSSAAVA